MNNEQISLLDDLEYTEFVNKFKPKLTTDDCYTPPKVFEAIRDWVCREYKIDPDDIVRPFYPGGDYESFNYPEGCLVLDNPPFSIKSKIMRFYMGRNIKFFLFEPALTCLSPDVAGITHIIIGNNIIYENGASVATGFVTNLENEFILKTAPSLEAAIMATQKSDKPKLPKYEYPNNVITAAIVRKYATAKLDFAVKSVDSLLIRELDEQRPHGKAIYGRGLLLSDRAAADRAAADERTLWQLSERELLWVDALNKGEAQ